MVVYRVRLSGSGRAVVGGWPDKHDLYSAANGLPTTISSS